MAKRSAEIEVKVTGGAADELRGISKAARDVGDTLGKTAQAGGRFGDAVEKFGDSLGSSMKQLASDLLRVASVANAFSIGNAVQQWRQFSDSTARFSAVAGKDFDTIRAKADQVANTKFIKRSEFVEASAQFGQMTYDAKNAMDAIGSIADEAIATGRTTKEMLPLATTLHNVFGVAGDTSKAFDSIRGQAEKFGTVGGVQVLYDQMANLSGVLGNVSGKGTDALGTVTGLVAAMQGTSTDPHRGEKMFAGISGFIDSHQIQIARAMHVDPRQLTDNEGKVLPEMIAKFQRQYLKDYGRSRHSYETAVNTFGSQIAKMIFGPDLLDQVEKHQGAKPTTTGAAIADAFRKTEAGKRMGIETTIEGAQLAEGETAAPVVDAMRKWQADHPMAAMAAPAVLGALGATGSGLLKGLLFGGGGAGGAGGGGSLGGVIARSVWGAASSPVGMFLAGVGGSLAASTGIVSKLNNAMPQIRSETAAELSEQRVGRVGAIVRAAERSYDDASFKEQLGPTLSGITDVKNGALPGFDPGLAGIVSFFQNGGKFPIGYEQNPQNQPLVQALTEALKHSNLQVTIVNETGGPITATKQAKGKSAARQ